MIILPKIVEKMPHVTFYWAGDGIYKDKILPLLENFENFNWLGNLDYPEQVQEFLSEIDIYALFSGMDGLGQSVIEASLMEKPVVATNVGGVSEIMKNNVTGYLVEKDNAEELIEKLSLLINDEDKRKIMGNAGRKFIEENFSWDIIVKQFIENLIQNGLIKK
jgi:glycosyltransferase involved in cell wall biosynthesis